MIWWFSGLVISGLARQALQSSLITFRVHKVDRDPLTLGSQLSSATC